MRRCFQSDKSFGNCFSCSVPRTDFSRNFHSIKLELLFRDGSIFIIGSANATLQWSVSTNSVISERKRPNWKSFSTCSKNAEENLINFPTIIFDSHSGFCRQHQHANWTEILRVEKKKVRQEEIGIFKRKNCKLCGFVGAQMFNFHDFVIFRKDSSLLSPHSRNFHNCSIYIHENLIKSFPLKKVIWIHCRWSRAGLKANYELAMGRKI